MSQKERERRLLLEKRLRQKERELRTIAEISRIIGQALPLKVLLDRIAAEVARQFNYPFCAILLSQPEDGSLIIKGSYGLDPHYIEMVNAHPNIRFEDLVGLPSIEVYRTGKPVAWEDVRTEPAFADLREAVQYQGYVAMAAVPLAGPGGILGTLTCYQTTAYRFSENELSLLATIAGHAAIAIDNKYLLERLNENVIHLSELNRILQRQHEVLQQSEDIHRRLTNLVLEERGLPVIVETLASLLDRGVCLYDHRLDPIARASAGAGGPVMLHPDLLSSGWLKYPDPKTSFIHLPAGPHVSAPALIIRLAARGKVLGFLAIVDTPELSEELERRAVEHAATVCALELVKQRNTLEVERRIRGNFIDDLLAGRFTTDDKIHRRAAHLGYNLRGSYRVLGVAVDMFGRYIEQRQLSEPQVADIKQRLGELIEQMAHQAQPQAVVAPQGHRAVILWPLSDKAANALDRLTSFATRLMAEVRRSFTDLTISVGVSTPVNRPAEFRRGYQEAIEALTINRNFGRSEALVLFDDLGVYSLLLHSASRSDLLRFAHQLLDPLIAHERRRTSDLIKTLEIALKHGLSPQQTAQHLFVHPNTVKHRLKQIRELIDIDFKDSKQLLELQLALLIRRLSGEKFDLPGE